MRLEQVPDADTRDRLLTGKLGSLTAARGWPHQDTAPGMSFLGSGGMVFLIIDDAGQIAGECGTKASPTVDGDVEIGYGLAGPSRGHGLGTTAVKALVDHLAELPQVRRIHAEVHVGNTPSWRVLERLGFTAVDGPGDSYNRYVLTLDRAGSPQS
jgi:RimJ/RimL family protein N-acetyltransferase